jgi:LPXTG-site transpeptidase (sortase) family protein
MSIAKPNHHDTHQDHTSAHNGHNSNHGHRSLHHAKKHLEPVLKPAQEEQPPQANERKHAIDLVRKKLAALYGEEPDATKELAEAQLPGTHHSKHQQYMLSLQRSGRTTAEIQADWHTYYQSLNDIEKRAVWQEFYSQNTQVQPGPTATTTVIRPNINNIYPTPTTEAETTPQAPAQHEQPHHLEQQITAPTQADHQQYLPNTLLTPDTTQPTIEAQPTFHELSHGSSLQPTEEQHHLPQDIHIKNPLTEHLTILEDRRTPAAVRDSISGTVTKRRTLQAKHHLKSLIFGLSFGAITLLILMFSFFNEVIIAPFLQPSRNVSATPIIVNPGTTIASDKDEIIIPKINVQIPLDFSADSTDKAEFEAALDRGVSHYPTTALPGEKGNAAFFGHSSNNIFNPGKYKFAFVLLNELIPGDTFYINYKGVSYAYQVYDKKIVEATQVDILNPVPNKVATALLVTCDPPGTSLRRLAVWGEQVSPNPNGNTAPAAPTTTQPATTSLPGNGKSLWTRVWDWVRGE